jgi:hypothetical protein
MAQVWKKGVNLRHHNAQKADLRRRFLPVEVPGSGR